MTVRSHELLYQVIRRSSSHSSDEVAAVFREAVPLVKHEAKTEYTGTDPDSDWTMLTSLWLLFCLMRFTDDQEQFTDYATHLAEVCRRVPVESVTDLQSLIRLHLSEMLQFAHQQGYAHGRWLHELIE